MSKLELMCRSMQLLQVWGAFSIVIYKFNDLVSSEDRNFSKQFHICRKLQSHFLILSSANKTDR
jgi:hypothetical protein